MKIDKFQKDLQKDTEHLIEALDKDSFDTWKADPVTKLFFIDMEIIMIDRMKSIVKTQPIDEYGRAKQSKDRGFHECLKDLADWNPFDDSE